jgi:uncharacterized protein YggE
MRRIIRGVAFLAAIAMFVPGAARSAEEESEKPSITVSGVGQISAAPDMATISAGVVTEGPTAADALRANSQAMAAVQAAIKERGVAAKDLQTSNLSIQPKYSQQPQSPRQGQENQEFIPRIVGYTVSNTVTVRLRDLGKVGELLDVVVTTGANQIFGISFGIDKTDALLDEARKKAVADARRKAELLAGEAGMVLGAPRTITESGGTAPPQPMRFGRGMAMAMAAPEVPVASGELDLSVAVQVIYDLLPPK